VSVEKDPANNRRWPYAGPLCAIYKNLLPLRKYFIIMILTKINYFEHKDEPRYWEIKDVILGKQNIIVGLNASGKTRLINIITNLAKILTQKVQKNGNWELEFKKNDDVIYRFELSINNLLIKYERIYENNNLILERSEDKGELFSKTINDKEEYSPPKDELTINIRRDLKKYPYLEDIIAWAKELQGYTFSNVQTNQILIPSNPEVLLESLTSVPYILNKMTQNKDLIRNILNDLDKVGYPVEKISVKKELFKHPISDIFLVSVKEKNLECSTEQGLMSQGMYRVISLIVILEYILKEKQFKTILIDDLGEGLDFERSSNLTRLLFEKTKNTDIQLIVTSNDRFLINAVDLKNINYLKREGPIVRSINYYNNRELFEKFILTGLNNFDFLKSKIFHSKN